MSLNGGNYATWKVQCKMALLKENLWNIVAGTETEPANNDNGVLDKYHQRCNRALAIIVLAVDPTLLYLLGEDPDNPKDVWDTLQKQFQKKSWANKLSLKRRLFATKLEEGGSMQSHIKMLTEIFNELAVVGDAVEEEDRVVHLLASLPPSYDMLVTAFEACPEVPKMETVTERLIHEERKISGRGEIQEAGLSSRSNSRQGPMCYKCKKVGHIKKNCPSVKKKKEKAHVAKEGNEEIGFIVSQHRALTSIKTGGWIIDSGASSHMCNKRNLFTEIKDITSISIVLGDGHSLNATAVGSVCLTTKLSGGTTQRCTLHDVLYVKDLAYNLFSVSKASSKGKVLAFNEDRCDIKTSDGKVVASGVCWGSLYYLTLASDQAAFTVGAQQKEDMWHRRYGHLSEQSLKKLAVDDMVTGLSFNPSKTLRFCEGCVEGKLHRNSFPRHSETRHKEVLGRIHSDVCGKMSNKSLSGAEYLLTFIDDKTRYCWAYFLKNKSEVEAKFKEWKTMVELQHAKRVKILRSDNGGEYTSKQFEQYLKKEGIKHELTIPKTPEQNGVAERMNRTVVEMTRSMLHNMPKKFWAEALSTAVYLRNRSPTTAVPDMTPYEALYGEKPDVAHLRQFGSTCYAHVPKDERRKLDSKARKCILLGYGDAMKGYRLYDESRLKVIHSRDVRFDEADGTDVIIEPVRESTEELSDDEDSATSEEDSENEHVADDHVPDEPMLRQSQRQRREPDRYGEWVMIASDDTSPNSYADAMKGDKKNLWKDAMKKEMESLHSNEVWELVPPPENRKVIGSKWVFKVKVKADGTIERYKARLVAQGFSQRRGLDYDETFCPVVRGESVRSVVALAASKKLLLHQMDVTTAFLNGTLEEEVYMVQPEGFVVDGKVCKLKKSIYGLKQSPRCWNTTLDSHLKTMGLKQSNADPCLYTAPGGEMVIVAVYVDDILIATETTKKMKEIKSALSSRFEVKDLGELKSFLGMHVKQDAQKIWIGQPAYATKILEKFRMVDSKPVTTPVETSMKLQDGDTGSDADQSVYQSAVGSLLYLSNWTRPDITYAVSRAARYCADPKNEHWIAVKRIIRYLKGTVDNGIEYVKGRSGDLTGYCDADWAGDVNDRKSTSGYVFNICGSPVSWRSKKQTCVALSTAEAEYVALTSAAQEAVWLSSLLAEIGRREKAATIIYDDSQSALAMSKNPQFHGRAKHIDIKYHYVREQVDKGTIQLQYCSTEEMLADILTKGLNRKPHEKLSQGLNLKNFT